MLVAVASCIRFFRGVGAEVTPSEALMISIGAACALGTPAVLWIRHLAREVWPSTPRAIEAQRRLRRTVLFSAATAGIIALAAQLIDGVLKQKGSAVAAPFWALSMIATALAVGAATWIAQTPRLKS